jgi:hypothetical protein
MDDKLRKLNVDVSRRITLLNQLYKCVDAGDAGVAEIWQREAQALADLVDESCTLLSFARAEAWLHAWPADRPLTPGDLTGGLYEWYKDGKPKFPPPPEGRKG